MYKINLLAGHVERHTNDDQHHPCFYDVRSEQLNSAGDRMCEPRYIAHPNVEDVSATQLNRAWEMIYRPLDESKN